MGSAVIAQRLCQHDILAGTESRNHIVKPQKFWGLKKTCHLRRNWIVGRNDGTKKKPIRTSMDCSKLCWNSRCFTDCACSRHCMWRLSDEWMISVTKIWSRKATQVFMEKSHKFCELERLRKFWDIFQIRYIDDTIIYMRESLGFSESRMIAWEMEPTLS